MQLVKIINIVNVFFYYLILIYCLNLAYLLINTKQSTLIDCLIQGVLLLQQSGAMSECVSYMYERYKKKLQVLFLKSCCLTSFSYLFAWIRFVC